MIALLLTLLSFVSLVAAGVCFEEPGRPSEWGSILGGLGLFLAVTAFLVHLCGY